MVVALLGGLRFKSNHDQFLQNIYVMLSKTDRTKIHHKRPEWPRFKGIIQLVNTFCNVCQMKKSNCKKDLLGKENFKSHRASNFKGILFHQIFSLVSILIRNGQRVILHSLTIPISRYTIEACRIFVVFCTFQSPSKLVTL